MHKILNRRKFHGFGEKKTEQFNIYIYKYLSIHITVRALLFVESDFIFFYSVLCFAGFPSSIFRWGMGMWKIVQIHTRCTYFNLLVRFAFALGYQLSASHCVWLGHMNLFSSDGGDSLLSFYFTYVSYNF